MIGKEGVIIVILNRPFVDSIVYLDKEKLASIYRSCFQSVDDRVTCGIYHTGSESERLSLIEDVLYLSIVGKTFASKSGKIVNIYDFSYNSDDLLVFDKVSYDPALDFTMLDVASKTGSNRIESLNDSGSMTVIQDNPEFWV